MADLQVPASSANEATGFPFSDPSTTNSQWLYDVFINHRGPDVKKSTASVLYEYLIGMGLSVFLDSEEFELGDRIPDKIQQAIRSSRVQIAILSKNYAHSAWCLAELALMLEINAKIVTVFHHVPVSFPRYCTGDYANAFQEHESKVRESKVRYSNADIQKWKEALHKVSEIKGWELNEHNDDQGKLFKDVVDAVLKEVKRRSSLEVAEQPIGLDEAVDDFNRRRERENNPKLVGIVGMCGSGKTTLAKHFFNLKHSDFDASCFLFEVSEESAVKKLPTLQRKILKKLLNLDLEIDSVSEGKEILKSRFAKVAKTSRFLIILDSIDHNDQVDALLVGNVLQTDSLIIITSRDRTVFTSRPEVKLYEMTTMNEKHARELFCWHAFKQLSPVIGSVNVVDGFVKKCYGLPLLLEEFGLLLSRNPGKKEWEIELPNLYKELKKDIKLKLQTSYDALDTDEKEMFQDVACFFIDHPKNTAIRIWNASGWRVDTGIQTLKYKSLIEVHHEGTLGMHDLFQYLGRDIAAADRSLHRRLWESKDIHFQTKKGFKHVLKNNPRFRSFLHLPYSQEKVQLYTNSRHSSRNKKSSSKDHSGRSEDFWNVQFFLGNDDSESSFRNHPSESSSDLLWLKWRKCPHEIIPSWIPMKSLRHLEIIEGDLQKLWHRKSEDPLELTELIIQWNPLTALPKQFGSLTKLQHIDFHGCDQLETLPKSFNYLTQLQYLDLSKCESLRIEPDNLSFGQTSSLRTLRLLGTTVNEEVLNQIVKLNSLESLIIGSDSLKSLPSVRELSRLKNLSIRKSGLEYLPEGIGELTTLQGLEVEGCPLTELTFTNSKQRKVGVLNNLHCEPSSSVRKRMCMLSLENITLQKTNVSMISISGEVCPILKILNLERNKDLVEVDLTLLSELEYLCLSDCSRMNKISGMSDLAKLKKLEISGCCELEELPSLARLSALERFTADKCWKLHKTGGVERLEGLKEFRLLADNRAIWNSFHGLQRLPSREMILGGRAAAVTGIGAEWNSLSASDYPDGTANVRGGDKIKICGPLCPTTSVLVMICFLIESSREDKFVEFRVSAGMVDLVGAVRIEAGEWIIASVFSIEEASWKGNIGNLERLQVLLLDKCTDCELKKAFIAIVNKGGEDKITEILNKIFVSTKDARVAGHSEPDFKLQDGEDARAPEHSEPHFKLQVGGDARAPEHCEPHFKLHFKLQNGGDARAAEHSEPHFKLQDGVQALQSNKRKALM